MEQFACHRQVLLSRKSDSADAAVPFKSNEYEAIL